jgi:hypothetical protein
MPFPNYLAYNFFIQFVFNELDYDDCAVKKHYML